jgi:adenylate/guanylate cyclase family protein
LDGGRTWRDATEIGKTINRFRFETVNGLKKSRQGFNEEGALDPLALGNANLFAIVIWSRNRTERALIVINKETGLPQGAMTAPNIRVTPEQPGASTTIDVERKMVTALFADIKGSTELMEDLDPEEARAIIDPALKLMIDASHRYDGYVVQSTGDGIFALFGAPAAHEDHPQRALYAALPMQEELKRYSARLRAAGNLPIEGRVGVNTGEVVVRSITTGAGQTEYTPIGHTTNLASRTLAERERQ